MYLAFNLLKEVMVYFGAEVALCAVIYNIHLLAHLAG